MSVRAPKPRFLVDESGRKSAVVLSVGDYERLLAALEEVADAEDFETARKSAKEFISPEELHEQVLRGR